MQPVASNGKLDTDQVRHDDEPEPCGNLHFYAKTKL